MEGGAVNKVRHFLAAFALLAVVAHGTALMAQHRIGLQSPGVQSGTRARHATSRQASWQGASQQPAAGTTIVEGSVVDESVMPDSAMLDDGVLSDGGCTTCESGGDCGMESCGSCAVACRPCCLDGWVQGEYLMWWPRAMDIPALVTSGTTTSEGRLGEAGTQVLVGDDLLRQMYSGARLRIGLWADPGHLHAWEVEGFFIGEETERHELSGSGAANSGVLARPFFNVLTSTTFPNGLEDAELVAFPNELRGTVSVEATSRLHGVGIHGMRTFCATSACAPAVDGCGSVPVGCHLSGFAGWRYMNLAEDLVIQENLTSLLPSPDTGQFLIEDRFETRNTFNGADLGVVWKTTRGQFSLDLLMRLGIGSTHQDVLIDGSTTISGSGDPGNNIQDANGGLLAQRTNMGHYERNRFAMVPELGVTLGCALTSQWRATVGYTFLYWSSVVRPGDQIDRDVNPNLLPPELTPLAGLERPVFTFVESDLWVNGLNLGLERTW